MTRMRNRVISSPYIAGDDYEPFCNLARMMQWTLSGAARIAILGLLTHPEHIASTDQHRGGRRKINNIYLPEAAYKAFTEMVDEHYDGNASAAVRDAVHLMLDNRAQLTRFVADTYDKYLQMAAEMDEDPWR